MDPLVPERLIRHLADGLRRGDLAAAEAAAAMLAERWPGDAAALGLRGALELQRQRPDAALPLLRRAVAIAPERESLYGNLAAACRAAGRTAEALAAGRAAVRLAPQRPELWFNLANIWRDLGRPEQAEACYRAALALQPDSDKPLYNLGNLLHDQFRLGEAAAALRRAVVLRGVTTVDALINLGRVLERQGGLDAAQACYERVTALAPDHAYARFNLALLRLRRGDFAAGWRGYEWRWRLREHAPRAFGRPAWRGERLAGTVLIHAEQGLGDTIQFCRYLPMVAARAGHVVLECQPPLLRLLRRSFPGITVVAAGEPLPAFDAHAPLMSLPLLLGSEEAIPAAVPYLDGGPPAVLEGAGLKVGVVWAGSPGHNLQPVLHAIPLADFAPLFALPGVRFHSLQKGPAAAELRPELPVVDLGPRIADFADTAAFVQGLDLVVTIDTSVAHLAGALGKPVWILLRAAPDWRWLLDRCDSPWYPTASLFRQRIIGDWREVMMAVVERLAAGKGEWTKP